MTLSAPISPTTRVAGTPVPHRFVLIVGAMKGGTTSLFDYLKTHPQIVGSTRKEPNFFSSNRTFTRGPQHYYRLWPDFDPAVHEYALEASANYTKFPRYPRTAERIARFSGRFKLLYVLRDPVDRIESHIAHNIAKGRVSAATWEAALEPMLETSRYARQLDILHAMLGTPDLLLLDFDELREDPMALLGRCTRFLGIDEGFAFEPRPPSNVRQAVQGSESFRLDPAARQRIRALLDPDIARLAKGYGLDVSRWEPLLPDTPVPSLPAVQSIAEGAAPGALQRQKSAGPGRKRGGYWKKRRRMMYYKYVIALAERLTRDTRSLIDVGSHTTSLAETFDWIPDRVALDIRHPYSSENVRGIRADFLTFEPENRYDFALCLQVLEHIPDAGAFARKLQAVADRVLVSVPYKWPEGACARHCQDPVDAAKLAGWFGREPDYQLVVEEPLRQGEVGRRLIAYFHTPGQRFRTRDYRRPRRP